MALNFAGSVSTVRRLARGSWLELPFTPGPGGGGVTVSARVTDGSLIEVIEDPEPGVPDVVRQDASVLVTIASPSGSPLIERGLSLRVPEVDAAPVGFLVEEPVEAGEWTCIVLNTGPSEIFCWAALQFTEPRPNLIRTRIAMRILNSAFTQVLDAIGLEIHIGGGEGQVRVNPELAAILAEPALTPFEFNAAVGTDINMSSLVVKAVRGPGNRPALRVFIEFETVGDTEIAVGPIDLVDITEATFEVTIVLETEGGLRDRRIAPQVSVVANVGVDFTTFGRIVATHFGQTEDSVEDLIDDIAAGIGDAASSSEYAELVGRYLAEAFVQLAERGDTYFDLELDGTDFVVVHYDPNPQPGPEGEFVIDRSPGLGVGSGFVSPAFTEALERLREIETIVVLMQENRSFDHMLGYLSLPGGNRTGDGDPIDGLVDGLVGDERNDAQLGDSTGINRLRDTEFLNSPGHEIDNVRNQIRNGEMSGFLEDFLERYPVTSVADENLDRETPLSYYGPNLLPVFDELARHHLICDRWFAAFPGATQPNRFCTLTGSTPSLRNLSVQHPDLGYLTQQTLFDRLSEARPSVDWCYYENDVASLRFYDRYRLDNRRVIPFSDERDGFERRAQDGTLPPVVFIDPNFVDVPPVRTANDDHPPADVAHGQRLVASIYDTLRQSSQWDRCMLIITYDEHGGFFDHVPPPGTAAAPGQVPPVHAEGPAFLGVRVPTLVVSPFVPDGGVSHLTFDHTSIAWTILLRFLGANARPMSKRMAWTNHLGYVIDPTIQKDSPLIDPPPRPRPHEEPPTPPGGQAPRLMGQPDLSDDFHEAIRWFGRPIIRRPRFRLEEELRSDSDLVRG
jgi:phospholipase C